VEPPLPIVRSPTHRRKMRFGKGFSIGELKAVGLTAGEAQNLGIYVDKRRKSVREENIERLKKYLEEIGWEPGKSKYPKVSKEVVEELMKVEGVNIHVARILAKKGGISSIKELAESDIDELAKKTGYSKSRINRWVEYAKKLLESIATAAQ